MQFQNRPSFISCKVGELHFSYSCFTSLVFLFRDSSYTHIGLGLLVFYNYSFLSNSFFIYMIVFIFLFAMLYYFLLSIVLHLLFFSFKLRLHFRIFSFMSNSFFCLSAISSYLIFLFSFLNHSTSDLCYSSNASIVVLSSTTILFSYPRTSSPVGIPE